MTSNRFSVATNFDDALPERIRPHMAGELFGKLPHDVVGGGRASYMLAPVSRVKLGAHIREARRNGIAFDYLLNSACLGNREFSAPFHRNFRRLLDWLSETGVE